MSKKSILQLECGEVAKAPGSKISSLVRISFQKAKNKGSLATINNK